MGSLAPAGQPAPSGFDVGPTLMVDVVLAGYEPRWCRQARFASIEEASEHEFGADQRALGELMAMVRSRGIVASAEPAHRNGKAAWLAGSLVHDVSILPGVDATWVRSRARTPMAQRALPRRYSAQTQYSGCVIECWTERPLQPGRAKLGRLCRRFCVSCVSRDRLFRRGQTERLTI